ncbi:uncharacterized protein LOC135704669 [Ochlerotatus camptorhynchus]|uniref:uncharacterized protein LOC135704669 n=1 Tax=Ochlerotatus camptorhynchus TaxID=644619 RepID=UPI0031E4597A
MNFPGSYQMAISRLRGLEKRLAKDPELRRKVNEQVESYEQKQYVRKVTVEEVANANPQRVWYLPLGVVTNPKKPNKIRMVWDATAKAGGVSFNDMLLKGPDPLVSLVDVLLRFREGKIAVCSDIREMFLRILIREVDKWSQCFLWRSSPEDEVQVYVINIAMFGATSSPCTAQFVKNKNALDYAELYPRATNAIINNHYVDDFLDSVNSVEEAVQLVNQEELNRLGETGSTASKSLSLDKNEIYERVLGVVWVPSADHFTFDQTGLKEVLGSNGAIPTKRQVLRTVMKLYDPLGFVAHFVVQGKILMQEIWRTGTDWDEPIAEQLYELWSRWIELYEMIDEVKVPRCFFGNLLSQEVDEIEVHEFTDASVAACACVAYLRMMFSGGSWCSLVAAKTKVTPLRTLSIPRLELWAAMMGSRLLQNVCSALTLNIRKRYLWTDSATVLAWLRSFLRDPKGQWPKQSAEVSEADAASEELRMAYIHRALRFWKRTLSDAQWRQGLHQEDFEKAEETLWRQAQAQAYSEELHELSKGRSVRKQSSLQSLVPFIDDHGVIRVGGRIGNAPHIAYTAKYPVILPRDHRITFLLMDSFHRRFLHANGETVLNELRQGFYIPKLRTLVRKVSRDCQHCKVLKAAPVPPLMGPLPKVRLTPFVRPFTYVGVDYMGPFEVKVGRSVVKRWICLFTCLTVRVVHLELAHSLSTTSCVMAFRRFVARRGAPLEVFSDNGTNFVGANRQLSEEKQKIQDIVEDCAATFANAKTQWHFNVPAAPHMGGPWERMVKSVKVAMKAVWDSPRHPSDEVLETIMLEAEAIVNSRPLTYVPLEAADEEALTPNHFLLYGSTGIKQPATEPVNVKPLELGDLVVIVDENSKNHWERGRICEAFPDKSGQVKRATVQIARGVFTRPAVKLAVLDLASNDRSTEAVASETEVVRGLGDVADTPRRCELWVNQLTEPSRAKRQCRAKRMTD